MGDSESLDVEHIALLDADSIPNENQSHNCFSCGEKMSGIFCYACGNKNDNYRRSIWSLGGELFSSLTALEGRIWRSLRSLITKPGAMARDYADGARQKWTSPVRMYLAASLILFGYVAISKTQLVAFGTKPDPNSAFSATADNIHFSPKLYFLERKSTIQKTVSDEAISAFERDLEGILHNDEDKTLEQLERELEQIRISLKEMTEKIDDPDNVNAQQGLMITRDALQNRIGTLETHIASRKEAVESDAELGKDNKTVGEGSSTDPPSKESGSENSVETGPQADETPGDNDDENTLSITRMSGEKYVLDSDAMKKAVSIALRQPERVNRRVNIYLPRIMFFMMPFSMLMGAIFIRGKKQAMLYDHLVHAAYIHAFSFLLLFVFVLLTQFTPVKGLLWVYTVILLIYLPLSAKRMFQRGWFKTFLVSYGVGAIYTFNMIMILSILIVMGLADIAASVAQTSTA